MKREQEILLVRLSPSFYSGTKFMECIFETRRDFLKNASVAMALPLILGCRTDSSAQFSNDKLLKELRANAIADTKDEYWGARSVPDNVSSKATLFGPEDKAEKILI